MRPRDLYPAAFARTRRAGEPYRPANGTEGLMFMERWCDACARNDPDGTGESVCEINLLAFVHDVGDLDYPREWQHGGDGQPRCTAFIEIGADPPVRPLPGQLSLFGGDA